MQLENARRLLAVAPDDAARLLGAAHAGLREAIAELQRLARSPSSPTVPWSLSRNPSG
jgi:hypothetical protein